MELLRFNSYKYSGIPFSCFKLKVKSVKCTSIVVVFVSMVVCKNNVEKATKIFENVYVCRYLLSMADINV